MTVLQRINRLLEVALCFVRKWWRPVICAGMGGALLVNGIILPLMTKTPADLTGLSALCVSLTPFAWLRTVEKREAIS